MQVLIWIFAGLAAGLVASGNREGNSSGNCMDLVMGAADAIAGGFLTSSSGTARSRIFCGVVKEETITSCIS